MLINYNIIQWQYADYSQRHIIQKNYTTNKKNNKMQLGKKGTGLV